MSDSDPFADLGRAAIAKVMNKLHLSYHSDEDGCGLLWARVQSEHFSGEGSGWFQISELREFHLRLGDFPISTSNRPSLTAGFYDAKTGQLDQCHVGITLSPHDSRGAIRVGVKLATEVWNEVDTDHRHELTTWFLVSYSDLSIFRTAFAALLSATGKNRVDAVLEARGN